MSSEQYYQPEVSPDLLGFQIGIQSLFLISAEVSDIHSVFLQSVYIGKQIPGPLYYFFLQKVMQVAEYWRWRIQNKREDYCW